MANKVQLKAAGDQDFKDNDPFAELTRIMGFDPRVQPTPRPDEDFEIDLEKELMGMFDPGPDAPVDTRYPQEKAAAAGAADELDEAFAAELEQELAGSDDFWEPAREPEPEPVAYEETDAYPEAAAEGLADVDMDFGPSQPQDAAPRWPAEERTVDAGGLAAAMEEPESEAVQPPAPEERNVYRPVFSAPGYTSRVTAEEKAPARQYGAVEAPVFDIRSFKSAAQQYREAAPRLHAGTSGQAGTAAPAEEKPRAKAIDPFDILAALGTDRGLPQRRDPLKANVAPKPAEEPAPAAPIAENPPHEETWDDAASAGYLEENDWALDAESLESALNADEIEEDRSDSSRSEAIPFLDIRPAASPEPAEQRYATADIDLMADAMHAYMAPAAGADDTRDIGATSEIEPMAEAEAASDTTPDIETTEVFEPAVAVADDLDIPVPVFEEPAPAAPVYDELDEEFEHAFQTLSQHTDAIRQAAVAEERPQPATAMDIERLFAEELGIGSRAAAEVAPAPAAMTSSFAEMRGAADEDELIFDDSDFLPDEFAAGQGRDELSPGQAAPAYVARHARRLPRRGRLLAGVAVGVLLLGGIGAFALSGGGNATSNEPVVLKADARPVKVKPKNPGGVNVPNQDNKVYERVEDGAKVAPEQKKLVSTEEKPVDISARGKDTALPGVFEDDQAGAAGADIAPGRSKDDDVASAPADAKAGANAPAPAPAAGKTSTSQDIAELIKAAPKGEERLTPTEAPKRPDSDVLTVTPHKVKTMIVRADGTMVPREDPAPAAASQPSAPAQAKDQTPPAAALPATAPEPREAPQAKTAAAKPAASTEDAMAAMAKADVEPAEAPKPEAAAKPIERLDRGRISTPAKVAPAPSRPAEQPVDIVGAVASAEPASAPVTAASGEWSVQIASQPTAEAAQTSYQNMARRYASVLGGHAVNIVKAEVAGKGTYYRVRIAAGSKDDAIALCTKYKAAGGSCFVSK